MKTLRLSALILAACAVIPSCSQPLSERFAARITQPPVYQCRFTSTPPVIDGRPDDEAWQRAGAITDYQDIRGAGFPRPTMAVETRMLWDYDNFYVCARLQEPYIRAALRNRDDIVWHDNDFEVFLDPDGDGINYFELEINALGTVLDLQMSHPYRSGGQFFSAWDCPGLQSAVQVCGTINDSTDRDSCWTVELAIPHKALSVSFDDALKQSRVWRINFSRVEWLREGGPEENWVWAPTGLVNIHMPERWAYVYLTGDPAQPRRPAAPVLKYDQQAYRFLWLLFYAQQEAWERDGSYIGTPEGLGLAEEDWQMLSPASPLASELRPGLFPAVRPEVSVHTTPHGFELLLKNAAGTYRIDHRGEFRLSDLKDPLPLP